jgi:hypothetical protein
VHVTELQVVDQVIEVCHVALEHAEGSDDQQARARIEPRVVDVKEPNQILDLLVADDAAHEHDVGPGVVVLRSDEAVGRLVEMTEVRDDGKDRRARKSEPFEILAVEFRIAHRQVAAIDVGKDFAAAAKA